MEEINPLGMTLLEVIKKYPEQTIKAVKKHSKVYQRNLSLINKINTVVSSPSVPSDIKVNHIKTAIAAWFLNNRAI